MTGPIDVVVFIIQAFLIIVLIRVVFSFVSPFPTNPISRFAWRVTEPVLAPIRRLLPHNLSPPAYDRILKVAFEKQFKDQILSQMRSVVL